LFGDLLAPALQQHPPSFSAGICLLDGCAKKVTSLGISISGGNSELQRYLGRVVSHKSGRALP
jgi:hypothetical protein